MELAVIVISIHSYDNWYQVVDCPRNVEELMSCTRRIRSLPAWPRSYRSMGWATCIARAHPTQHHVETCTDDADCARSEYNVIANLGIQMAIRPHTPCTREITTAETCTDHSDPLDHPRGNVYRLVRIPENYICDLYSDLLCPTQDV